MQVRKEGFLRYLVFSMPSRKNIFKKETIYEQTKNYATKRFEKGISGYS